MSFNPIIVAALLFSFFPLKASADASATQDADATFAVIGACSWGPKAFFGDDECLHQPKNALAIFVRDNVSGEILVSNEMATREINYCQPIPLPETSTIVPVAVERSRLSWTDSGATSESSLTYLSNVIGVIQTSTNSVNVKNAANGGKRMIYAPCFFTNAID